MFTFLEVFLNALEALLRVLSMSLVLTCSESGSVHWIKFSWFIKRRQRETQRLKLNTIKHDLKSYIILCCQCVCHKHSLFLSPSLPPPQPAEGLLTSRDLSRWYSRRSADPVENCIRNAAAWRRADRGQHRPLLPALPNTGRQPLPHP